MVELDQDLRTHSVSGVEKLTSINYSKEYNFNFFDPESRCVMIQGYSNIGSLRAKKEGLRLGFLDFESKEKVRSNLNPYSFKEYAVDVNSFYRFNEKQFFFMAYSQFGKYKMTTVTRK
jgi:hypothetical protein